MKPIFYTTLFILSLLNTNVKACRPAPTLFERILEADVISQLSFAIKDSVAYQYKTYDDKIVTSHKIRVLINEKANYKGRLDKSEIFVSKWAAKYLKNATEGLFFMTKDSLGNLIIRTYFLGSEPSIFEKYKLSEHQFAELCFKTKDITLDYRSSSFEKLSKAVIEVSKMENHFTLFDYLDRTQFSIMEFGDSLEYVNFLKAEHIEKLRYFFKESSLKSDLTVRVAHVLKFENREEVLVNHLNTYYCSNQNNNFENYDSYYAKNLESYLIEYANSDTKKETVASFVKKRYSLTRSNYVTPQEIALFDTIYPSLNVLSQLENLKQIGSSYYEKSKAIGQIMAQIGTYRPNKNEPELRNNFCAIDRVALPTLEFGMAPNPTDGPININFKNVDPEEDIFIQVISLNGNVVYGKSIMPNGSFFNQEINFGHLPAGMYQVMIFNKYSVGTETLQVL